MARAAHAEAEAALRRAIALAPDDPVSHSYLGVNLALQGRHDEAEAAFRRAIELDPKDPVPYRQLGISLMRRGGSQEADDPLRHAAELAPDDFPSYIDPEQESRPEEAALPSTRDAVSSGTNRGDLVTRVEEGAALEIVGWRYLVWMTGASVIGTVLAIGGTLTEPTHTESATSWIFIGALILSLLGFSLAATLYIERRRQLSWVASLVDALNASPLTARADEGTNDELAEAALKMAIHLEEAEAFEESRRLANSVGSQPLAAP